jgi:hypothetical protein
MTPTIALSNQQMFGFNILPQNIFKIYCEPDEGLAKTETYRSVKQNRIWFCLDYYKNLCINLLEKSDGISRVKTENIFPR